jgi:hypothetical protein
MGSGFDDWVYYHFFTITINYYSSQSILTAEASLQSASRSTTDCKSPSQSYFMTVGLPPISSSWRQAPWGPRPDFFSPNWTPAVIVLINILSDKKMEFVSYEYAWLFVKYTYRTYNTLLKILPFALHTSPPLIQALRSRSCLTYVSYVTTAA